MLRQKRVPLERGWTLWPISLVRGAGFPIEDVLALAEPGLASLARLAAENPVARPSFDAAWPEARARQRALVRAIAAAPRFREAVTWQNRQAVATGLDSLLRHPERDDSRARKKELLVVSYLQRYAAKCETIGFFGPVGWGRWTDAPGTIDARPAAELLDARQTFFEPWVFEALIDSLGAEREVAEVMPLRLAGWVRLARGKIANDPEATADEGALASLVDGRRHARAIAKAARRRWPKRFTDEGAAIDGVFALVAKGVCLPALPMAIEHHPERRLAAIADRLESPLRERLKDAVLQLVERLAGVRAAAGDDQALAQSLELLEATFTSLTGQAAKRNEGRAYAGRALVYEETRRAGRYALGEQLRSALSEPLALMLDVSRWFTSRVARGFMRGVEKKFDALGGGRIPLDLLWQETSPLFDAQPPAAVAREVEALQALFAKAAPIDESVREQRWSSAALRKALGRSLKPVGPAWPGARHHAPDVMLSVRNGELVPVLGELHVGVTPFTTLSVLAHCPVREELEALFTEDLAAPHVTPVPWEDFARSTHDARLAKDSARWHVDLGFRFTSPLPPSRVVRVAELVVSRERGQLVVKKGAFRAPLLSVLERRMKLRAAGELHPFAWKAHRPRLWIDGVVVARESWREKTEGLAWASSDAPERFLGATAWAKARGFPRFVFVRSPAEVKPIYVDFESPLLVDLLCRFVRGAPEIVVSEMLPAPDELWLTSAEGQRFVCELRLLAVDAS